MQKTIISIFILPILIGVIFIGGNTLMQQVHIDLNPADLTNPGFEDKFARGSVSGWDFSGPEAAFQLEGEGHSGKYRLTQRGVNSPVKTLQTLQGLENGWYTLRAWVRSSGRQKIASIALIDCGSAGASASVPVAPTDQWLQIVASAEVTGGQCTVVLGSEAGEGDWVSFDDLEFVPGRVILTVMGADISSLKKSEDLGGIYLDQDGKPGDALQILKDHGLNAIRLRIWVDPADGYHDATEMNEMGRRAKELGLKVLVDFHYSDTWADPGKQHKPSAWIGYDFEALKKAVYIHTFETCTCMAGHGARPDMVQIGNEINSGMLWPDGHTDQWDQLAELLKEGYRAVKDCSPKTQVMLHIAEGGDNEKTRWWFDNAIQRGVPFDVIGVSYYPYWHGTLAELQHNLNDLTARYDKDVIVVETAYPFTTNNNDHQANIISSNPTRGYPFSPAGQAKLLADVMAIVRAVPDGRGLGIFYWEATWTAVPGNGWLAPDPKSGNGWENQALFDFENRPLPAMGLLAQP